MRKNIKYPFENYDVLSFRMLLTAYPNCFVSILTYPSEKKYKLRLFLEFRPIGLFTFYDSVEFTEFSLIPLFLSKL